MRLKYGCHVFFFLLLTVTLAHGQDGYPPLRNVSVEDAQMKTYSKDTSAVAVILYDWGEALNDFNETTFERRVRIKVLKSGGLAWADFSTLIPRDGVDMKKIHASTYNMVDGRMVETKMDPKAIFKSKFNRDYEKITFTLPNVKIGSVLDYGFTLKGSVPGRWEFQYSIPVETSVFRMKSMMGFMSTERVQGIYQVTKSIEKEFSVYSMVNVPAFKKEPFMDAPDDAISQLYFYRRRSSWPNVIGGYLDNENVGPQLANSDYLNGKVNELLVGVTRQEDRLKVLVDYVKKSVEWTRETDRIPDHTFDVVLKNKKGTSSEINLLLATLLRKVGITTNLVLINTRDAGKIDQELITTTQFNDVILQVEIDGKKILIDATDRDIAWNVLPERCLNTTGAVCLPFGVDWVEVTSVKAKEVYHCDLKMNEDGDFAGKLTIVRDGLAAGTARKEYRRLGEKDYLKNNIQEGWEVTSSKFLNMDNPSESAREEHELKIHDVAQAAASKLYLNAILAERITENMFQEKERLYPVELPGPFEKMFVARIEIPSNYVVDELPAQHISALAERAGRFTYSVTQNGNFINVVSHLQISKISFSPQEYGNLKELFDRVVAKHAEQIVLRKK